MSSDAPIFEPRALRFPLGLFALAALAFLLAASWLRAFVPVPRPVRVRDVSWLEGHQAR